MGKVRQDFITFDVEFEPADSVKRTSITHTGAGVNFRKHSPIRGIRIVKFAYSR